MLASRTTTWLATGMVAGVLAACASGSGSQGISRGPSNNATVVRVAAPPDTVMQRAWEVLRTDGIQPRWFSRSADDSTNIARMESDWIYVPRVLDSAAFGSLSEPEKYVKMLLWAEPERGGTLLYVEAGTPLLVVEVLVFAAEAIGYCLVTGLCPARAVRVSFILNGVTTAAAMVAAAAGGLGGSP